MDTEQFRTDIENLTLSVFQSLDLVSSVRNKVLKKEQKKLDKVKYLLGRVMKSLTSKENIYNTDIEVITKNMDEQDRIFIQESYSVAQRVQPLKTTIMKEKTMSEIIVIPEYNTKSLNSLLQQIGNNWNFDMFFLAEISGNRPISVLGPFLMDKYGLEEHFAIPGPSSTSFFRQVELKYLKNPYHNATHGADVMASLMYFVIKSDLCHCMTNYEILGSIIATLGHDILHPGLTNRFLINNREDLAVKFNDVSVLEMMHCATLFDIMQSEEDNILAPLSSDVWVTTRKLIIEMILATDMSRHFDMLGQFRAKYSSNPTKPLKSPEQRLDALKIALKAADIGHAAKHREVHERWSYLVMSEFFNQGDLEKAKGLKVSMYCDRETTEICQSQMGFLKNIAMPLYGALNSYFLSEFIQEHCIEQVLANYSAWEYLRVKGKFQYQSSLDFEVKRPNEGELEKRTTLRKKGGTAFIRKITDREFF